MKKKIALIAVVLFTMGLFTSFAEAKGCGGNGNGTCAKQNQQKQDCEKSGTCEKNGSCEKDGTCDGEQNAQSQRKGQGQGQGQAKGNGNGYRGGRG